MTSFQSRIRKILRYLATRTRDSIVFLVITATMIGGGSYVYAAWTAIDRSQGAAGQTVSSTLMQGIIDNINDLNTRVSASSGVPSGFIGAFNLASCPTGWIAANGTSGTPDLRGEFIRGLDSGRGVDIGRTLGSWQRGTEINPEWWTYATSGPDVFYSDPGSTSIAITGLSGAPGTYTVTTVGVRPRNIALLYCQKQ